jgi:hypothetical protein
MENGAERISREEIHDSDIKHADDQMECLQCVNEVAQA